MTCGAVACKMVFNQKGNLYVGSLFAMLEVLRIGYILR